MGRRSRHGGRSTSTKIGLAVLMVTQAVVVTLVAAAAVRPDDWLLLTALGAAISGLGAGAVVFVRARRLARSQDDLRSEIEMLADQPLAEMLIDVVTNRDIAQFRTRIPVVSDPGLAQLADQVEEVCSTGLRIAAEHEELRQGYIEVFVNMFRRTQSLLQRQLQIIERLERGDQSPADMHLFFQLDHLVTRMRRNNENVLVLTGTELVRATKNPVTISDVFRAAMSEVEKYQKIRVLSLPSVRVSNTAAGDLIRIIAELLDNATTFSPPDKEVTISAELGRYNGLSIGVFDNGIGMSDEDVRKLNERLKKPGSADTTRSRRVGLFVVGMLAGRHGFEVELFGGDDVKGVSALVSIPSSVLLDEDEVRAMLPRDSRRTTAEAHARDSGSSAVTVNTSVRRTTTTQGTDYSGTSPSRMSPWYTRSQVWRTKSDMALRGSPPVRDVDTSRVDSTHANVPEELPMRKRTPELATEQQARAHEGHVSEPPTGSVGEVGREELSSPTSHEPEMPTGDDRGTRVASRWFKARGRADGSTSPPQEVPPAQEQAWHVSQPVAQTNSYTYTEDGLPLRRHGAHLQPGIAAGITSPNAVKEIKAVERDPASMQRRLSGYQSAVQKALEQEDRMRGRPRTTGGWTVLERKATK